MKVELNLDGVDLSKDVKDILANLTPEQKREVAATLLRQTMLDADTRWSEKQAIKLALDELIKEFPGRHLRWGPGRHSSTDGLRAGSDTWDDRPTDKEQQRFDQLRRHHSHVNEFFYTDVFKAIKDEAQQKIREAVAGSPLVQEAIKKMVEGLMETAPQMVQQAMTTLFFNAMREGINSGSLALANTDMLQKTFNDLQLRLRS